MLELNKVHQMDCLKGLKLIEDNSIDLIITSPPYNKAGLHKIKKQIHYGKSRKWNETIDYGGFLDADNMDEEEYEKWQIDVLNECYRVLKPNGSVFYNHKNRIYKGSIISPYKWLFQSKFIIRQEIIWDRGSTHNVNRKRYLPTTEQIFWLTKTNKPTFDRLLTTKFKNEVWNIPFERNNNHPAPFPIDIPNNIISCVKCNRSDIIVLDPFMGSGTTALSAKNNDCKWIGFELFDEYIDMTNKRLQHAKTYNTYNYTTNTVKHPQNA